MGTGTLREYIVIQADALATRTGERETWGRPAHAI